MTNGPNTAIHHVASGQAHQPTCSIWDTPEDAAPDALLENGIRQDAVIVYLGAVRPIFDAFNRVLGQISGLLLLASTSRRSGLDLDHRMFETAIDQLNEARERLRAVRPPEIAEKHYAQIDQAGELLGIVADHLRMAKSARRIDANDRVPATAMARLGHARSLLMSASEARAGMTPVDFTQSCCSCGAGHSAGRPST